jgi:hypothetical protein
MEDLWRSRSVPSRWWKLHRHFFNVELVPNTSCSFLYVMQVFYWSGLFSKMAIPSLSSSRHSRQNWSKNTSLELNFLMMGPSFLILVIVPISSQWVL